MKRNFLFVTFFLFSIINHGQVLYGDSFDEGIQNTGSSSNYAASIVDNTLNIVGNGSGGQFEALDYTLHNNGVSTVVDISSNPKIYIKAKASPAAAFRIDVKDSDTFISNLTTVSASLTNQFQIYELDYDRALNDGGYGGSDCTPATAPCPVDPTKIASLVFFVNPGAGNYNGTIEVQWISIGEPLEALPPDDLKLRYNQVSYFTDRDKIINVTSQDDFSSVAYQVFDGNDQLVLSGTSDPTEFWNQANEYASVIDVTSVNTEGTYRLVTDFDEITFQINDEGYSDLRKAAFKYYYFNRASTEITAEYGGVYARPSGHPDTEVRVHSSAASPQRPAGTIISAPKGWYDAGDYNKYIVNSGISTYTLLAAYEHFENYYKNTTFDIPEEGGSLPDILDEVIWNLDWMLAMQDPNDGGVYHKLTGLTFSGIIMPDAYTLDRYVVQKTTAAALNLAAVMAQASRVFEQYESQKPGYSAQLLQAAKDAYAWAKANPAIYYSQPSDVQTGQYGDGDVTDEFQWAAVELFITSGEAQYKNDINVSQIGGGTPYWGFVEPLALMSIAHYASELSSEINVTTAMNTFMATANALKDKVVDSPMRIAMGQGDYSWGSNGQATNQVMLLIKAYEYSGDDSFLEAAYVAMDYLLGRNGTGYCFVSGFGDQPMQNPHHRISEADAVAAPVPGMLAGGPHSGSPGADGCVGYPSNNSDATTYVDTWCSYASNEVTINWNAPLVYAVNALHLYKNNPILSVEEVATNSNKLKVYPNPTKDFIYVNSSENLSGASVIFYSIQGKKIYATQLEGSKKSVDINDFSSGIYLMEVKIGDTTYIEKVLKE